VLAALDALRELDLLRGGQERNLADVLQEELERVGRDLGLRLGLDLGLVGACGDDRDLCLLERGEEVVELRGLEVQLVERERELVGVDLARAISDLQEALALVAGEGLLDRRSSGSALRFFCGQTAPLPRRPSHGSYSRGGRQSGHGARHCGHVRFGRLDRSDRRPRMRATKEAVCRHHHYAYAGSLRSSREPSSRPEGSPMR
jgi:hypothetical protein